MPLEKSLLKILACPKCKGTVKEKGMFLTCSNCKLAYPILDSDIPDMLIQDAWPINKARNANFSHNMEL